MRPKRQTVDASGVRGALLEKVQWLDETYGHLPGAPWATMVGDLSAGRPVEVPAWMIADEFRPAGSDFDRWRLDGDDTLRLVTRFG